MYVRLMRRNDIDQVAQIDREAFPTEWPPTNFARELDNRLAYYIVVCENPPAALPPTQPQAQARPAGILGWLRSLFSAQVETPGAPADHILGYAGMWVLADEAHIMSIASHPAYRRKGIGEALLFALFDLADKHKARLLTLEVRISNTVAQNLYLKFGFKQTGMRKGYYLDNREDALIMSTDYISAEESRQRVTNLLQAHRDRWGSTRFDVEKQNVKLG